MNLALGGLIIAAFVILFIIFAYAFGGLLFALAWNAVVPLFWHAAPHLFWWQGVAVGILLGALSSVFGRKQG